MASVIAFWDTTDLEQEFILPKLPGITEMDNVSLFHKNLVLEDRRSQLEAEWLPGDLSLELQRLKVGSQSDGCLFLCWIMAHKIV